MKPIRKQSGFTEYVETDEYISISHRGNMGNSIDSVNQNLNRMDFPPISVFKRRYKKFEEKGSPDYMYEIVFTKPPLI